MTYEYITNRNMSDFSVIFVYVNDVTNGLFINMLLLIIFLIVTIGLFLAQKRNTGEGDFPLSLAVGSFITTIAMVLLSLVNGLVSPATRVIVIMVTMLSVLFFLFSDKN